MPTKSSDNIMTGLKCCNVCKKEKKLESFPKNKPSADGRGYVCKDCHNLYCKERYNKGRKGIVIKQNYARRILLAKFVDSLKENQPCVDCGKTYEPFCMDFDHLRDKKMGVSKMVHECFSKKKILEEIKKTELVCAYCHRTRTHNRNKKKKYNSYCARNRKIVLGHKTKNSTCNLCKKQFGHWLLDFDHINPSTKIKAVSLMMVTGWSEKKLKAEMVKCQLVCVICHRRKTFKENNYKAYNNETS